ncbi:peptide chain release factor PrfB3, chloroplastic isoform X1 [Beta vulgaris subsp. vulgaris]|uniref:peptide chain release factor PrfB3, chloroplastic isoform X1 n=1 Tax=Beta vulgaris subsp. vulgaris TaxID=3555 RepID=UPI002036FF3F|nr:peptide chain release factor PrfB3, chloroplastic isoform X1 [Beta vulgaris subsp. vulgaris]
MAANAKPQPLSLSSKWEWNCQASINKMTRTRTQTQTHIFCSSLRASHSMDDNNRVFKQLGMFSLRKKIEDAVLRGEMLAPTVLHLEEEMHVWREEEMLDYNLWDDPVKSNEMLAKLADRAKVVDTLKDLAFKIEEAKLIKELAETDAVNFGLFKQAYNASIDISKFLDQYEMSKLLKGPYDVHGASLVIRAGDKGIYSEIWVERLLSMYIKWAEKQGHKGRVLEKCSANSGGIKSATIEFEFKYAYGFLIGERGVHRMRSSLDESSFQEVSLAVVDVIPLFLEPVTELLLDDKDLIISYTSSENDVGPIVPLVHINHAPTGICVQSSGERNKFANKMKALNRLKAKLLVVMSEQETNSLSSINKDAIIDLWKQVTRRYMLQPYKLVEDVKTGIQTPDLNSVLNGNINLFITAHASLGHAIEKS